MKEPAEVPSGEKLMASVKSLGLNRNDSIGYGVLGKRAREDKQ